MNKKIKIIIALIAGALCGASIPAAIIWSGSAVVIGIVSGTIATVAAMITGITVTKES
jgi:hypothetical protein